MFLFGKYTWLKRGDPFAVLFALFARFSPTEVRVVTSNVTRNVCDICISGCSTSVNLNSDVQGCVDCYECWEMADDDVKEFSIRRQRQMCIRDRAKECRQRWLLSTSRL